MSFSPKSSRVSVSTAFTPRSNTRNATSNFRPTPYDRLGTIVEYGQYTDASNRTYPTIVIKEDETGRVYEAKMSDRAATQAQVARSSSARPAGTSDNFRGNIIDDLMQKHLPVGDRVVLEGTLPIKGGKVTVGGVERSVVDCNYITHVTEPSPKKTYRAIITAKADSRRQDGLSEEGEFVPARARDYQDWSSYHKSATAKDSFIKALSTDEELEKLSKDLDESRASYEAGQRRPSLGVLFRTVITLPLENNEQFVQVIDDTPLFEWVRAERDPNDPNKVVVDGYPLDAEEFRNLHAGYRSYIFGNEAEEQPAKFDAETLSTAKIEVAVYNSHMASNYSKYNQMSENPKHPLRRLCFTPTKHSQDDAHYSYGKNIAVSGIMMLTGDQFDKSSNTIVSRDMVRRVFFGGPTGNLHSFIRSSEGFKARVHPALDNPAKLERANAASGTNAPRPTSAPATSAAPAQSAVPFDDDDVPFEAESSHNQFDLSEPAPAAIPSSGALVDDDFFNELLSGATPTESAPAAEPVVEQKTDDRSSSSSRRRGGDL